MKTLFSTTKNTRPGLRPGQPGKRALKGILLGLAVWAMAPSGYAQQQTQSSLYFFNPMITNPGYAGSQGGVTVTGSIRDQWTGFKGAPKTQALTVHSPIGATQLGAGISVIGDQIGANKTTGIYGNLAYHIRLNSKGHRLALGVKAGVDMYRLNLNDLAVSDNTDGTLLQNMNVSKNLLNIGAGLYYYGEKFYIGASCPQLLSNKINSATATQAQHYYGFAGVVFRLNSLLSLRPSVNVKYVQNAPVSVDANLSLFFNEKIWLGVMYRYNAAAGANIMYQITPKFRIGYAYDYTLNPIQRNTAGSHEFMLSYNFRSFNYGVKSPRYF